MADLRLPGWTLALTFACALHARALRAQSATEVISSGVEHDSAVGGNPAVEFTGCMANIPDTSRHRVPVFLSGSVMRRADSAFSLQADLIAQDVAAELRLQLGGNDSVVTSQDGRLAWSAVPRAIVVTALKNGEMSADQFVIGGDSTATLLLLHAFAAARAGGAAMMAWPDQETKDTVYMRLDLWPHYIDGTTKRASSFRVGRRFPAFVLTEPEEQPAVPLPNQTAPPYPGANERMRYSGRILMEFTVDTAGRVVPATIRDVWPGTVPRLKGMDGEAYNAFVNSLRTWLEKVRFQPARLGSCVKRQSVQWPFEYRMSNVRVSHDE